MRRELAILALAGCAACATAIPAPDALEGRDLDLAVSLYGPWQESFVLEGATTYVWRRHFADAASGQDHFCELHVQMGFQRQIGRSLTKGAPVACDLFAVRFETTSGQRVRERPR